jgi:hypothetical protein
MEVGGDKNRDRNRDIEIELDRYPSIKARNIQ